MTHILWRKPGLPRPGMADGFVALLRTALAADPDRFDLLRDLTVALGERRLWAEIVERLTAAATRRPLTPELAAELAHAAERCGDPAGVRDALEVAIRGAPRRGAPVRGEPIRGEPIRGGGDLATVSVLAALGRTGEALAHARAILDRDPHDDAALSLSAEMLLQRGEAGALTDLLDAVEARGATTTTLLACRANALAALGDADGLARLLAPAQWCVQTMLGQGEAERDGLAEAILAHPDLAATSGTLATQGRNRRLDAIGSRPDPQIRAALSLIRDAIDTYVATRCEMAHPLMTHPPAAAMLQGWALVMTADGHEARHIHPRSWLTAVYYVRVPQGAGAGESAAGESGSGGPPPPGSLVFGPWPTQTRAATEASDVPALHASAGRAWHILPRAGMLAIFPSFFAHGTVPTGVAEPRLCLSLDVVPCAPPAAPAA